MAAAQLAYRASDPTAGRRSGWWLLGASAALAGAALTGWVIGSTSLVAFLPGLPTMKFNTALAFLALTIGIAACRLERPQLVPCVGLPLLALTVGALSLWQSLTGTDIGFDQWLVRDTLTTGAQPPGRPAPATAVAIVLLAIGGLLPASARVRPLVVLAPFVIGYTASVGLLFAGQWSGTLGQAFTTVSVPTAACVLLLSAVLLSDTDWLDSEPARGTGGSAGAQLLRAVLPLALVAPASVFWLQSLASRYGWWDAQGGLAIAATATTAVFIGLAVRAARWVDARQADLQRANRALADQVQQRTQALRELRNAHDATEAALRTRADFLSRVSHELRTPLNAILGFAQLMRIDRTHPLDAQQRFQLAHVETAGRQLVMLVDDLLDFGRDDAGRVPMTPGTENAAALARLAIEQIGPEATLAGISLDYAAAPRDAQTPVHVDRGRLLQVLANLLSNAVKYNRPGGSVRVGVRNDGREVVIEVADSGEGLAAEQLAQLFVPFNRLGREGGSVPGSGIGLALAQRLMGLMGGRIEVRSQPGVGSVFSVHLPVAA